MTSEAHGTHEREVVRLRQRLDRERKARREAERIAEDATRSLYHEVAIRTRELESLIAMGRELALALDRQGFADVIARHAAQAVGFDECGIYTWDRTEDVVVTAGYYPPDRRAVLEDRYDLDVFPETREVLMSRRASIVREADATADPSELRFMQSLGGTLMVQIPMVVNGHAIGTIELLSRSASDLDERQLGLAQTMANEAGVMLENSRLYAQIRHQALHDSLTGLPNRTLLVDRLTHALERGQRHSLAVAVLFVDIDDFKVINDTFGHDVGDHVLTAVASRLAALTRSGDTVARISGDEFSVLLEDLADARTAEAAASRLVGAFEEPIEIGGREIRVSVSVGVDVGTPATRTAESLLANADFAMYGAKRSGKGRHRSYEAAERRAVDDDVRLRLELRRALANDEFRLEYQPIVELAGGAIRSLEALVRWRHADRGVLLPGAFIGSAEETGVIVEMGEWVLRQACVDLKRWQVRRPDLAVAVNLSGRQLHEPALVDRVRELLHETGVPPVSLIVEVTETMLVTDPNAVETLHALKDLGVRVAIDDFGTGYASIGYLRRFPVDIMKIDREFVRDAVTPNGQRLLGGIVQLGRSLGLTTIAEGVETPEQRDRVAETRCELGQGYLFGRPASRAEITRLVVRSSPADRAEAGARSQRPEQPRPASAGTAV